MRMVYLVRCTRRKDQNNDKITTTQTADSAEAPGMDSPPRILRRKFSVVDGGVASGSLNATRPNGLTVEEQRGLFEEGKGSSTSSPLGPRTALANCAEWGWSSEGRRICGWKEPRTLSYRIIVQVSLVAIGTVSLLSGALELSASNCRTPHTAETEWFH